MCLRHFGINCKMTLNICFNLMSSTSSQDIQLCSSIEKDTAFKLIEISKEPLKLFWMRENREEGKSFQRMGLLLEGAYQWEMGFWLLFHFSGHFPKRIPQEFFKVPELGQFKIIKRFHNIKLNSLHFGFSKVVFDLLLCLLHSERYIIQEIWVDQSELTSTWDLI